MPCHKKIERLKAVFQKAIEGLDEHLKSQAFTHVSYSNEKGEGFQSNERLEFLGDAVISLAVALNLYERLPGLSEGELTRMRAALVSGASLSQTAQMVDLGSYLKLGRGEELTGGRARPSILAGAFEAVIGAYFIQYGWERTRELVTALLINGDPTELPIDPKSLLQEFVQKTPGAKLEYRVISVEGPDHSPHYNIACLINGKQVSTGRGSTKKEAEENSAREYLQNKGLLD